MKKALSHGYMRGDVTANLLDNIKTIVSISENRKRLSSAEYVENAILIPGERSRCRVRVWSPDDANRTSGVARFLKLGK
jgi:hypothetical protein